MKFYKSYSLLSLNYVKYNLPSVKKTWAALYMMRFPTEKSLMSAWTDFSDGVMR